MSGDVLALRPYQEGMRTFAFRTPFCALWADMGLGKTPTALTCITDSLYDSLDTERWLVVAPKLVALDAWPRQLRRWRQFAGLSWRNLTAADLHLKADWVDLGDGERRRAGLTFGEKEDKAAVKRGLLAYREDLHLCSWHLLPWLVKAYGANWPYDGVVLDEAIFAANSTSDQHKAAWQVIQRLGLVRRVIQLTGAPTPNGYEQLHGQIRLLDGGARLGKTKGDFTENWLTPDRMDPRRGVVYKWKLANGSKERIDAALADIAISLRSDDYLSLPEFVVNPIPVPLGNAARTVYAALERDLLARVGEGCILAPNEAVLVAKLMQVCNGAVYDDAGGVQHVHDAKLDRLAELLESVDGPVLLAYSWQHDFDRIAKRFGKAVAHIKEPRALDRFRAGAVKLLCMQPASGAHGLDGLQEASATAVWFGATYNADHWMQFNKRLHRDGQRAGRVTVHQLLAERTIEEQVAHVVTPGKIAEQDALLEAVRMRLHCAAMSVSDADTR